MRLGAEALEGVTGVHDLGPGAFEPRQLGRETLARLGHNQVVHVAHTVQLRGKPVGRDTDDLGDLDPHGVGIRIVDEQNLDLLTPMELREQDEIRFLSAEYTTFYLI